MDQLTEREHEVAALFVDDLPDAQIVRKVEQAAFQAGQGDLHGRERRWVPCSS
jgi:hypothetical protein